MKRLVIFGCTGISILLASTCLYAAEDGHDWPRKIEKDDATIIIYQPQVESLTAIELQARAAVSVTHSTLDAPVFGAMWFDCNISTDRDERTVSLLDVEVSAAKFPEVDEEKVELLSAFLEEEIPRWELEMSLDQLVADLDMNETAGSLSEDLNNAPPEILFRTTPSVLVMIDGDPVWEEVESSGYERVLNTPFFIVRDRRKGEYYIHGAESWYHSDDFARWDPVEKVPRKVVKLADDAMGEEESGDSEAETEPDGAIPEIILRTTPAELLQSNGEPEFSPVEGTSILYMTNTADDILMNIETQEYFIRVSGRWYRSSSISDGPWSYVEPDQLPDTFEEIPSDSDMATVRSSIPGTREAKEAVLENQIPQTAEVDRNDAELQVSYDGSPQFEAIEGTEMQYAVNTNKSVLLIGNRYYCCDNAIWFEADSPAGPWIVSTVVPETVQEIPPESPVYNVKYVRIYDYTPSVVYVGYTPGYMHSYVYRGCVYYGTGYYYRPWYGRYYYPRPVTYGYGVHWNPYTGWGFSFGVSYGWMTFGWGTPYRGWWGPAGYRHGYHYGYHHGYARGYRAGYYAGYRASYGRPTPYSNRAMASNNIYRSRSQGVRRTGNTYYDPKTGNRISPDRSNRPTARPADRANNHYTDRNGNVYRRDGDSWNRVDNSGRPSTRPTQPTTRPSARPSQPDTRPTQPTTRPEARPSQPDTRPSQPATRPTTRPSQPSFSPSQRDRPGARPGSTSPQQNLNRDYNSRSRGAQRSQQYNQSRPQQQYSRPSPSRSTRPSAAPGRSGSSRPASPSRRR